MKKLNVFLQQTRRFDFPARNFSRTFSELDDVAFCVVKLSGYEVVAVLEAVLFEVLLRLC